MYLPGLKGGHVPLIWGSMNPVSNVVVGDAQDMVKVVLLLFTVEPVQRQCKGCMYE